MRESLTKGFTTVELIFVLCILAIIFAILVPVYPVLSHRMKVNVDKTSAGNIANAVRSWYSDYSTDTKLKEQATFLEDVENLTKEGRKSIALSELDGLEKYVDVNTKPCSLQNEDKITVFNQKFFVSFIGKDLDAKVVITVGTEGVEVNNSSVVDYDGSSNGIIYIGS